MSRARREDDALNKTLAMSVLAGALAAGVACTPQNAPQSTAAQTAPRAVTSQAAMTEAHARSAMMGAGCSNISALGRGPQGSWHGQCTKGGQTVNAVMDGQGKVTTGGTMDHMTESRARYAMMEAGCSNISSLNADDDGTWRAQCTKGGRTVDASIDGQGKVTTK